MPDSEAIVWGFICINFTFRDCWQFLIWPLSQLLHMQCFEQKAVQFSVKSFAIWQLRNLPRLASDRHIPAAKLAANPALTPISGEVKLVLYFDFWESNLLHFHAAEIGAVKKSLTD